MAINVSEVPGVSSTFKVWYERDFPFPTYEQAMAFAIDLHARKTAECAAYNFSPPSVHIACPPGTLILNVGDKVQTSKGSGIIDNREECNEYSPPRAPFRKEATGRYGVKLDHKPFADLYKNGIAYFFPNELTLTID